MARPPNDYQYREFFDPTRKPTWRYDTVQRRIEEGRPLHPQRDDKWMHQFRRYCDHKRRLQQKVTRLDDLHDELAAKFRHIWCADKIFNEGSNSRTRYGIEANILAKRTPEQIATRARVEPQTIVFYQKIFFNVVDRLDSRDYIASQVLAPAFMAGLSSKSLEMTAKYFGYFAGPHALDLITDGFTDEIPSPQEPSELSQWLDRQFRSRIRTSAMVGITYMDPTNYNIRTLLEGFQSLLSLSNKEMSQTGDDNVINRALQILVTRNPVPLGNEADELPPRPGLLYGNGSIEPRVAEIAQLADGRTAPLLEYYNGEEWENPNTRGRDKIT